MSVRRHSSPAHLWFRSCGTSVVLHGALLLVGLGWWIKVHPAPDSTLDSAVGPTVTQSYWTIHRGISLAELEALAQEQEVGSSPVVEPPAGVLDTFVQKQLQQKLTAIQEQSADSLQSQLERYGSQLQAQSTSDSVQAVGQFLQGTLGISNNEPMNDQRPRPDEGPFDSETAQIDDVLQETGDDGSVRFLAVLIDEHGRRQQVELDPVDGQELYDTFQLIKKFPLLEKVYREVVQGLLNQMLQAPPEAEAGSENSEPIENGKSDLMKKQTPP